MTPYMPMDADGDPLARCLADCCCDTASMPLDKPARALDVEALLASGAMEGPFFRPHPITLTWRVRIVRALRRLLNLPRSIL
jgi:hypothetical protein